MTTTTKYVIGIIVALVLIITAAIIFREDAGPSHLDPFASCLKEKGFTFYGAFWCPHCRDQKKIFGTAAKNLPYVECSTPDAMGQVEECNAKGIEGYPTWEFPDGTKTTKVLSLQELAAASSCVIPPEPAQ